jgi:uncharacterized protein YbjT (DUF2867 family)
MDVPAQREIAAVGVRVLTEDGHPGAKYVLTSSQTLTQIDQVHTIGAAIGRPLRFEEVPPEQAGEALFPGAPPSTLDAILSAHADMVTNPEPVTTTVEDITRHPAHTYRQWATDHANDFR